MMVVILQLLKALNMISESRWTLELNGTEALLKEWDKDSSSCIRVVVRIRNGCSNAWEVEMKEYVQFAIVREATPPKESPNDPA